MKNTSKEAYYERLRNLSNINKQSIKESTNRTLGTLIDYKRAADGVAYGIVKENHQYYIKKGGAKKDPDVTDFAYIGGLANITNFQYKSLSEADKSRNMLFTTINESTNMRFGKNKLHEDKAGMEIDNAESRLDDLDAATATETSGEEEMAAGLQSEPAMGGGEEPAPDMGGGEEMPEMGGEEGMGGEEPAPEMGGEEGMGGEEDANDPIKELEKNIGKITNTIRKTELEPAQVQSMVNSYLSAFKDKFPDVEIEDRKEMANRILKVVPPEDVESLGSSMPADEVDEECNECGNFARYAESMGYESANALRECGEEEVSNLVSGYANAHADGMNDGDPENVALVVKIVNPEILNTLRNDYGHNEYADKLEPHVNQMDESQENLDELFGKFGKMFGGAMKKIGGDAGNVAKNAGQAIGQKATQAGQAIGQKANQVGQAVSGAATQAGQAIGQKATQVGQAVSGAVKQAGNAVGNGMDTAAQAIGGAALAAKDKAQQVGQAVGQYGQEVKQAYHAAGVGSEMEEVDKLATDLKNQIMALNTRLQKAGKEPLNMGTVITTISNQLRGSGTPNLAGTKVATGLAEEVDPEEETGQDDGIKFAPASQSLGVATVKPDGAPTTITLEGRNGTKVDIGINEVFAQIKTVMNAAKAKTEEKPSVNEEKLRKYIRNYIEVKAGVRKGNLNEGTISPAKKRLNESIDNILNQHKHFTKLDNKVNKYFDKTK